MRLILSVILTLTLVVILTKIVGAEFVQVTSQKPTDTLGNYQRQNANRAEATLYTENIQQKQDVYATNRAVYSPVNHRQYHIQDPVRQYVSSKLTQVVSGPYTSVSPRTSPTISGSNDFRSEASSSLVPRGSFFGRLQRAQNQEVETFDTPETSTDISESEPSSMLGQFLGILLSLFGKALLSGSLTSAFCTFTPLCSISFLLSLLRSSQGGTQESSDEDIDSNGIEMLREALEKYTRLQAEKRAPENAKFMLKDKTKAEKSDYRAKTNTRNIASNVQT